MPSVPKGATPAAWQAKSIRRLASWIVSSSAAQWQSAARSSPPISIPAIAGEAAAISSTRRSAAALSTIGIIRMAVPARSSAASTTWSGPSVLVSRMPSAPRATHASMSATAWARGRFTRTSTSDVPPARIAGMLSAIIARASSLRLGGTLSSRSRITASAPAPGALARKRGTLAGT